ncbi:MAG TPA: hypothetical protein VLL54_09895 [Pyrinomonadaceae bacterium]|nr:hypothetical protein [Pyrinomonadaceae bacterium]
MSFVEGHATLKATDCRSASRQADDPDRRVVVTGFRIVLRSRKI